MTITGTVIRAGEITDDGETFPGIIIECTREEMKSLNVNPYNKKVTITFDNN